MVKETHLYLTGTIKTLMIFFNFLTLKSLSNFTDFHVTSSVVNMFLENIHC